MQSENTLNQSNGLWSGRMRALGPSLLMATAAIGGSHLVASTQAGALFGWQLAWVILLVNILKYPFFRFAIHYTLTENKSLVDGYAGKGRAYLWLFTGLNVIGAVVNTAGVLLLTASLLHYFLSWIFPTPPNLILLSWLILASCLLIIMIGKYRLLDSLAKALMLALTLTTITAVLIAWQQGSQAPPEFISPSPWELASIAFVVAMVGWMPAPIEISVINSLWLRTKQQLTPINYNQGLFDLNVGFWVTTLLALAFLSLGALIQHGTQQDVAMASGAFAQQLVSMYSATIGEWARWLVAVIAFLCMYGTTLTVLDGYSRGLRECWCLLRQNKMGAETDRTRRQLNILLLVQATAGMGVILFFAGALGPMLTFAMTMAFLTTPVFAWLNFSLVNDKHSRKPLGRFLKIWGWLGFVYLTIFALGYLAWLFIA